LDDKQTSVCADALESKKGETIRLKRITRAFNKVIHKQHTALSPSHVDGLVPAYINAVGAYLGELNDKRICF
jgi:hypothetical protein